MVNNSKSSVLTELGIISEMVFEFISDIVVIIDKNYKITYLNDETFKKELEYMPEKVLGKYIIDFIHPKDRNYLSQILEINFPRKDDQVEIRLLHKNGTYLNFDLFGKAFTNEKNVKNHILIFKRSQKENKTSLRSQEFMEEISSSLMEIRFWKLLQSRKSKKVVEKSQELLQFILDNIPNYVAWKDKNSIYLGCNKNFAAISGLNNPEEIIGKTDFDLNWKKKDAKRIYEDDELILKSGKANLNSETILSIDGQVQWFDTNRIPLKESDGTVIGVLTNYINITERKLAHKALTESEKKFRHLFENTPYAIWIMDMKGNVINYNSAMEELLSSFMEENFSKNNFTGRHFLELVKKSKEAERLVPLFRMRFKKLIQKRYYEPIELKITNYEGEEFWVSIHSTLIDLGDKKLIQTIIQNITDKKRNELNIENSQRKLALLNKNLEKKVKERTRELEDSQRTLILQNEKLKKTDKIKNEFIQYATHELKTPLISIGGYVDYILVKHQGELNPEITEDLNIARKNVSRLEKLMNQLLDVMKIEEKRLSLNLEKTDIKELIEECIKELSFQTNKKQINVITNLEDQIILNIDSERIFQVFSNILSNAIKFSPPKGEILINAKEENEFYLFIVKDNGIGIESGDIENLFSKFEKIRNPLTDQLNEEGTGLGLYISKGIINAHKGKIWISSKGRNRGTSIYFTLPM